MVTARGLARLEKGQVRARRLVRFWRGILLEHSKRRRVAFLSRALIRVSLCRWLIVGCQSSESEQCVSISLAPFQKRIDGRLETGWYLDTGLSRRLSRQATDGPDGTWPRKMRASRRTGRSATTTETGARTGMSDSHFAHISQDEPSCRPRLVRRCDLVVCKMPRGC